MVVWAWEVVILIHHILREQMKQDAEECAK